MENKLKTVETLEVNSDQETEIDTTKINPEAISIRKAVLLWSVKQDSLSDNQVRELNKAISIARVPFQGSKDSEELRLEALAEEEYIKRNKNGIIIHTDEDPSCECSRCQEKEQ